MSERERDGRSTPFDVPDGSGRSFLGRTGRPRVNLVLVMVVPLVLVGFLMGYRLGPGPSAPSAPAVSIATPRASPSPPIEPDLAAGTVSEELRQAYYAGGAGVSVCLIREAVRCTRVESRELRYVWSGSEVVVCVVGGAGCPATGGPTDVDDPSWQLLPAGPWPVMPETALPAGHLILVADLSSEFPAVARLAGVDAAGVVETIQALPAPINPEAQGIDYFDLGWLDQGRHLVLISRLTPTGDGGFLPHPSGSRWTWRPLAVELDVQAVH